MIIFPLLFLIQPYIVFGNFRASNPLDPEGVKEARKKELEIIRGWLKPSSEKKTPVLSKLMKTLRFSSEKNH